MTYKVYRAADMISLAASDLDGDCWEDIVPLELTHYMGEKPLHIPRTQVKLTYNSNALYVIFRAWGANMCVTKT